MQQSRITQHTVADLAHWAQAGELELAPRFQRRSVWPLNARSYFIDTVLRGLACPPLFLRLTTDVESMKTVREVVDGQQRLFSVLGYLENEFALSRTHNQEFGGRFYKDLPDEQKRLFLGYRFVVEILEDVSDAEVLGLFARLNTNTVKLNSQELRNARYFGFFKQLAYDLALSHYAFWQKYRILTDRQIARMLDAEFVSELLLTMMDGIRSTRAKDLEAAYSEYEEDLPQRRALREEFSTIMDLVGTMFEEPEVARVFRRRPRFFSLFIALYDARFGLPESRRKRLRFTAKFTATVAGQLAQFAEAVQEQGTKDAAAFYDAARLATSDPSRRRERHDLLWDAVLLRAK